MSLMLIAALVATLEQPPAPQAAPVQPDSPLSTAAAVTPPAPTEDDDPRLNERVCRTEMVVGTRFNSRICMTRREWNQRRDQSRELVQRLDTRNSRRNSPALANTASR